MPPRPPPLPLLQQNQLPVRLLQGKASWAEVWEHALQEVQVATVLRMLMDDAQTSVVTAAAQALAVLVGPGRDEEEAWQAADDNPTTGDIFAKAKPARRAVASDSEELNCSDSKRYCKRLYCFLIYISVYSSRQQCMVDYSMLGGERVGSGLLQGCCEGTS